MQIATFVGDVLYVFVVKGTHLSAFSKLRKIENSIREIVKGTHSGDSVTAFSAFLKTDRLDR